VILMEWLIHKGGGERRTETVCGCVQLKDPSVNHTWILRELEVILMKLLIHKSGGERRTETVNGCVQLIHTWIFQLNTSIDGLGPSFSSALMY
jgi:hypothetical protein